MKKKKFRLFDAVLMAVVVVMVVESAAPAAAIGPSQFFWWGLLLVAFFLPYGLIAAELGTTYDGEGGIYDWVVKAFGKKWGARVSWYYWINFPIWMASLAILFTEILFPLFGVEVESISKIVILLIQLAFIWGTVGVSYFKVSDSKWILNIAAVFKAVIMISIGVLGIYIAVTKGVANTYTLDTMLPSLDSKSLMFLSIIIFNFLGAEVVTTMAPEMEKPQRDLPKALILGGILIAFFYIFAAFGIGVAIPTSQLSPDSGLIDSFIILVGSRNWFVVVIGIMFLYTLAANLISWAVGVNYVALYAAKNKGLPKVFSTEGVKTQMPKGVNTINGIVASVLVVLAIFISGDFFWSFFALNVVTLLLSYTLMFPAFRKLRKIDSDTPRPFKIKGNNLVINIITFVPLTILIVVLILTVLPVTELFTSEPIKNFTSVLPDYVPLIIGVVISIVVGEFVRIFASREK